MKNGCKCLILRSRSRINSWNSHCDSFTCQSEEKLEKKPIAPHYLSEPFASALTLVWEPSDFFCHIIWRQREVSPTRAKRGKKATPRYVAEPFASLRCIDKGFRGICATL